MRHRVLRPGRSRPGHGSVPAAPRITRGGRLCETRRRCRRAIRSVCSSRTPGRPATTTCACSSTSRAHGTSSTRTTSTPEQRAERGQRGATRGPAAPDRAGRGGHRALEPVRHPPGPADLPAAVRAGEPQAGGADEAVRRARRGCRRRSSILPTRSSNGMSGRWSMRCGARRGTRRLSAWTPSSSSSTDLRLGAVERDHLRHALALARRAEGGAVDRRRGERGVLDRLVLAYRLAHQGRE